MHNGAYQYIQNKQTARASTSVVTSRLWNGHTYDAPVVLNKFLRFLTKVQLRRFCVLTFH